jgi:hypothetical protein
VKAAMVREGNLLSTGRVGTVHKVILIPILMHGTFIFYQTMLLKYKLGIFI